MFERTFPDVHNRVGYRNTRKSAATIKRCILNVRHRIRYRYARKPAATVERIIPDARHRVGYRHARERATIAERTIPDARNDIWNDNFCRTIKFYAGQHTICINIEDNTYVNPMCVVCDSRRDNCVCRHLLAALSLCPPSCKFISLSRRNGQFANCLFFLHLTRRLATLAAIGIESHCNGFNSAVVRISEDQTVPHLARVYSPACGIARDDCLAPISNLGKGIIVNYWSIALKYYICKAGTTIKFTSFIYASHATADSNTCKTTATGKRTFPNARN